MSEFLKFAYEVLAAVLYNIAGLVAAFIKLFITGWKEYWDIFTTYFPDFTWPVKILSIILMLILVAIPVLIVVILIRHWILKIKLKHDNEDNVTLYKEIGRLNKQVLDLMDEKNKILALKVSSVGKTGYVGTDALLDADGKPIDVTISGGEGGVPSGATINITGAVGAGVPTSDEALANAASAAATAAAQARTEAEQKERDMAHRFPKLSAVDAKYEELILPEYRDDITLNQIVDGYRMFAAGNMHLYYTEEIVRRFVAGLASSKLLILEGISGTGKTSLPYSFSRYLDYPSSLISVQPSYRDRTELLGYFNEFSKRFNETEFLRALYEASYRPDVSMIVLDEMNLARIEYYFAEMLSVLEMPSHDEWVIDLVPTGWPGDPKLIDDGKITVAESTWFIGTANNDDSTFTITDKVYDRAMPIELNERAQAFECEPQQPLHIKASRLVELFEEAKENYPISEATLSKMFKLDEYLQTRFKLAFGNRIIKQMYDFIPVYVACGGTELDAMDYIIARKVLKKFESMNVTFVRDEIKGLIVYIEKLFGKTAMQDSKMYLTRIQNLY